MRLINERLREGEREGKGGRDRAGKQAGERESGERGEGEGTKDK